MKRQDRQKKAEQLRKNKIKGKAGEAEANVINKLSGYSMVGKHTGKDYIATRRNPINPSQVIETRNVEVKTGKAKLSKRQEETKKKEGLDIYRTNAFPYK